MGRIHDSLRNAVKKHAITKKSERETLDQITPSLDAVPLFRTDLVIEAAVEDMAVKKALFASLAARSSEHTILATNTSALSVTELAAATPHPERVIGIHFFNPPHLMPLVEVITHAGTTDEVAASAVRFVQSLGKTPVLVKDSPGFVVNRILMPYLMASVRMASTMDNPWAIDEAMTAFGLPMGPLRLLDEIGFDVAMHVAGTLGGAFPEQMKAGALLAGLVKKGMLGRKCGAGFYLHTGGTAKANPSVHELLHTTGERTVEDHAEITDHLVSLMRDEAQRCLDDRIVTSAGDINLAMTLGTGFPPFRKLL
jgi:3-hydroxyacyl-CoA dehydrogenase/enoyl-CoA hydratase/3-hydroxybutyryl-CoA epimerase